MARIRSIHPGFFTDEHIVTVSSFARLLLLGILTESDDNGAFEWKPLTLKMRIFPADTLDIFGILEELESANTIKRMEINGRECGIVRNFCRYQHPKKPNIKFPVPNEFRAYVGLDGEKFGTGTELKADEVPSVPHQYRTGSPSVRNQFPTSSVPVPPEDGEGGKREVEEGERFSPEQPSNNNNNLNISRSRGRKNLKLEVVEYAFQAGIIRLNSADLEQWRKAFPNLSLESELTGLAGWAEKQQKWFNAVAGALAKKQRETLLAIEKIKAEVKARGEQNDPGYQVII